MILPIYAFGQPVLKKVCEDIDAEYPQLPELIANMWETMYNAPGIGLAAPQIGLAIRLFVIDTGVLEEDEDDFKGIKKIFINATIEEESGEAWEFEEGCLSIPSVRGNVERQPRIRIHYFDENFVAHDEIFEGVNARVIQHEYDHIEGILFTELLKPLKRRMLKRKLEAVKKGKVSVDYNMKFFTGRRLV